MFDRNKLRPIGTTSSSLYEAEGGSPTFDLVPFRVSAGKHPALGTFVLIGRQGEGNVYHYGRIVQGSEINPKAQPSRLQQDEAYGMARDDIRSSEQAPDLVRVMQVELLGEIHLTDGDPVITDPRSLPQTGQAVYEMPARVIPKLLGLPEPPEPDRPQPGEEAPKRGNLRPPLKEGALYIGHVESGGETVPLLIPGRMLARHIAIVGKTGVGKSYAAGVLIEELVKQEVPVIAFDILGDTEQTTEELGGKNWEAGKDFLVPYSIIGAAEFLDFFPTLTRDQKPLVDMAYDVVYGEALAAVDRGKLPDLGLDRLLEEIEEAGRAMGSRATTGAVRRIRSGFRHSLVLTDREVDWPNTVRQHPVTNIYVGHLGQRHRNLVVGAAARILQRLRRRDRIPPFVLILDEAHLFLPGGGETTPSTRVIREMIRTARHDGIGIVLLSQSPSSMDKQALLTCNTRIVFALDPDDRRVIAGQMGDLPEVVLRRLSRLPQGTAVIASAMDLLRHPVLVHIRERETEHPAKTPNLIEEAAHWEGKEEQRQYWTFDNKRQ